MKKIVSFLFIFISINSSLAFHDGAKPAKPGSVAVTQMSYLYDLYRISKIKEQMEQAFLANPEKFLKVLRTFSYLFNEILAQISEPDPSLFGLHKERFNESIAQLFDRLVECTDAALKLVPEDSPLKFTAAGMTSIDLSLLKTQLENYIQLTPVQYASGYEKEGVQAFLINEFSELAKLELAFLADIEILDFIREHSPNLLSTVRAYLTIQRTRFNDKTRFDNSMGEYVKTDFLKRVDSLIESELSRWVTSYSGHTPLSALTELKSVYNIVFRLVTEDADFLSPRTEKTQKLYELVQIIQNRFNNLDDLFDALSFTPLDHLDYLTLIDETKGFSSTKAEDLRKFRDESDAVFLKAVNDSYPTALVFFFNTFGLFDDQNILNWFSAKGYSSKPQSFLSFFHFLAEEFNKTDGRSIEKVMSGLKAKPVESDSNKIKKVAAPALASGSKKEKTKEKTTSSSSTTTPGYISAHAVALSPNGVEIVSRSNIQNLKNKKTLKAAQLEVKPKPAAASDHDSLPAQIEVKTPPAPVSKKAAAKPAAPQVPAPVPASAPIEKAPTQQPKPAHKAKKAPSNPVQVIYQLGNGLSVPVKVEGSFFRPQTYDLIESQRLRIQELETENKKLKEKSP